MTKQSFAMFARVSVGRALIAVLLLSGALAAGVGPSEPGTASAEVPGLPFTNTECEAFSDSVARLYVAAFNRAPEASGFAFWMSQYTGGGHTLGDMAAFFASSDEFVGTYGSLSDRGFVERLYINVLGRRGDAGGIDFWSGQLSLGATRGEILLQFSESPENVERSGTRVPVLGYYNEGVGGPFECGGQYFRDCPHDAINPVGTRPGGGVSELRSYNGCLYASGFIPGGAQVHEWDYHVLAGTEIGLQFDATRLATLAVFSPSGQELFLAESVFPIDRFFVANDTGTYTVKFFTTGAADYELEMWDVTHPVSETAPLMARGACPDIPIQFSTWSRSNQLITDANRCPLLTGDLSIPGSDDKLTFRLAAGDKAMLLVDPDSRTEVLVTDPQGAQLARQESILRMEIPITATQAGVYTIDMTFVSRANDTYELQLFDITTPQTTAAPAFSQGSCPSTVVQLAEWPVNATMVVGDDGCFGTLGELTVPGEVDGFAMDLRAGEKVRFRLDGEHEVEIVLRAPNGSVVLDTGSILGTDQTITVPQTGRYEALVNYEQRDSTGTYEFFVTEG